MRGEGQRAKGKGRRTKVEGLREPSPGNINGEGEDRTII